jgi:DNA polymerase-1
MPDPKRQLSFLNLETGDDQPSDAPPPATDSPAADSLTPNEVSTDSVRPSGVEDLRDKSVYVIDSHSLIFQVFHAIDEMTSPKGEPVSAVYGFTRDILQLLENRKPDFLLCAFDRPGPTFRHELFEAYKADRAEMPEELSVQLPMIRDVLDTMGIPTLEYDKYEADDVLATVARVCEKAGANCYVVTGDKDCRQLITDRVKIYNVRKDHVYDRAALEDEWGIRPDQVVDFQALVGDAIDNVPGIPLIGPKIARQLLEQFDTLEKVLDHADEVPGKKRSENLRQGRETALLSRDLVRLVDDVPVSVDWAAARTGQIDPDRALSLFRGLGFRSLTDRMLALAGVEVEPETWEADYRCVRTQDELAAMVDRMSEAAQISFDVETTHIMPRWAEPVGYALACRPGEAYYVPVRSPDGETCLDPDVVLSALRPLLEEPKIEKIGQNLKYDIIVLRSAGGKLAGVAFDTMLASYLLEAGERNHNLDDLSRRYLEHETIKISSLIGSGKKQKRMDEVPLDEITPYAAEDADVPLRLRPILQSRLEGLDLVDLYRELELPLIDVLADMEFHGIKVDTDRLAELSGQYRQRLESLEEEIHQLAGREFNIASPKQLAEVLFGELGLPVVKRTKSGPSTDADVLEQLADQHPLPAKIVEYRQFSKLKNTYVDALPSMVHPETGRVHASFNQVVAATGRLSSSDPNLQNIPIRTDSGREIRSAFLPSQPDWSLLAADYSQIELRILAHYTGDEALTKAFQQDEDIHALVASQVFGVAQNDVTPEMRRRAKAVNFGVIYGQTPFGLAKGLNIEVEEAAEFIDAYFERYPRVDQFVRDVLEQCRKSGYVSTIFGRRRSIRGVRGDTTGRQRNFAERTAVNTVIQGSAADLIKRAMINVHRRLGNEARQSRMLLQIHDELVFEVPPDELDIMTDLVRDEMVTAVELKVPLRVDVKVGSNWAETEPV